MSLSLLIKPASASCNMRCKYCFYIDEVAHREKVCTGLMSEDILDTLMDRIYSSKYRNIRILFQGGEPTLAGISYYRYLTKLINNAPRDFRFSLAFQTNGLDLDQNFADWFKQNKVLVGVSLDGPSFIHDKNRIDINNKGTFDRVMRSVNLLKENQVDFNILCVVTKDSVKKAKTLYRFFKQNHLPYQQYIECLAPIDENQTSHVFSPKSYGRFLKEMFDEWYRDKTTSQFIYNRYFEDLLMVAAGRIPGACNMQGQCSEQWVLEADGSVYPCDFYVLDQWKLGNVLTDSFEIMSKKRKELKFIDKSLPLPQKCKTCAYYKYCRNGCMRTRTFSTGNSVPLNTFCDALKEFLPYAVPKLEKLIGH